MPENQKRIFLGIPIPSTMHAIFANLLQDYQSHFLQGHWVLPENLHITVRFFGDIDSKKISALWDQIKNKVTSLSSFYIDLEKIDVFPYKNSSIVAAFIQNNLNLNNLFSIIQSIDLNYKMKNEK